MEGDAKDPMPVMSPAQVTEPDAREADSMTDPAKTGSLEKTDPVQVESSGEKPMLQVIGPGARELVVKEAEKPIVEHVSDRA